MMLNVVKYNVSTDLEVPVIKNFEEVRRQLAELSDVINKYKSEQVQLKLVELIFRTVDADSVQPESDSNSAPKRRARRKKTEAKATGAADQQASGKKRNAVKGTGPVATLEQFIQEGFFGQKRTIGSVVEHCKTKARNFKNNELSGPLGRLVRNNKLSRTKNSDGQWEYSKK